MPEALTVAPDLKPEVKKLSSDKWLGMKPGMETVGYGSQPEQWGGVVNEKDKMTYGNNNGILAAVDGEGQMQVAPYTSDRLQSLQELGYTFGGLWVPLSNGERPTDPALLEQWERMRSEASAQNLQERIENDLRLFQSKAEERGVSEVGGEWLTLDGAETEDYMKQKTVIEKSVGTYNMPMGRLDQVGTYGSNNGTIAFVDGEGKMQVAPYTSERMRALNEAHYRPGNIWVPLSNGERPTDPVLLEQWERMRAEASDRNLQERIESDLRRYRSKAEERGISGEVDGEWLILEGAETQYPFGEKTVIEKSVGTYNMPMGRLNQVGTYGSNNGTVAFVNEKGQMCVAPATSDRMRALNEAGYRSGGIWVPLSNGEQPTDPVLLEQWEKMRTEASDQNLQERIESDLRSYQNKAEERGIKGEVGGEWLVLDGAETQHFFGEKTVIEKSVGTYNMPMGRLDQVGTYSTNNGTVAFVNERGQMCVAPATSDRMRALNEAGYRSGGIWVPLSNGEQPTDPALLEQWERMRAEARR